MSDAIANEIESLKARVAELEDAIESESSPDQVDETAGLDHRDRAVLNHMRQNGKRGKLPLVRLYISLTDIQDKGTAKRRARTLEQTDVYRSL